MGHYILSVLRFERRSSKVWPGIVEECLNAIQDVEVDAEASRILRIRPASFC